MPGVAVGFLAILALGLFYRYRGLPSDLMPLASLATVVVALAVFGMVGLLVPGGYLVLLASLSLGVYSFIKMGYKAVYKAMISVGFLVFLIFGLAALVWFGVRMPLFSQWDEFSFWGTVVKMMKLQGELYTTAEAGWFWTATEMPALPLLGWFVQLLSAEFLPWAVLFVYALLVFACASALVACVGHNLYAALPLSAVGLLLPFVFLSPKRITSLSIAYLTAYGDVPAGLWFGGALAFYLAIRKRGNILWALLPLAGLALIKDNTFSISLVAAGLIFCDILFFLPREQQSLTKKKSIGLGVAFMATPLLCYISWRLHTGFANAQNTVTQGQSTGSSPLAAVQSSLLQLLGVQERSEALQRTLVDMLDSFVNNDSISMLGTALHNTLFILLLFVFALFMAKDRLHRARVLLWGVLSALGFLGFQFVLLTFFAFLSNYEGGLPDYTRYQKSYFVGWLVLALAMLAQCAIKEASTDKTTNLKQKTKTLAAQSVLVVVGFGGLCLFGFNILDGYSVLDYPSSRYDPLYAEQDQAELLSAHIEPGARTFYVNQDDTGLGWFKTHYHLMPNVLDYSFGGGRIVPQAEGNIAEIVLSREELQTYLSEENCEYIYLDAIDESFVQNYGTLFSDGLSHAGEYPALYQKGEDGLYAPVEIKES